MTSRDTVCGKLACAQWKRMSSDSSSGGISGREYALKLMETKELIEAELNTQFAILTGNGATMTTALVDEEGFPRAGKRRSLRADVQRRKGQMSMCMLFVWRE